MPVLDLTGAKRLEGYKPSRGGRRTLDAGSIPGLIPGSGSGGFAAAKINRLTMDFIARSRSADQDLFGDNIRLRARARKLALDNPFVRKFLRMLEQNVVGPAGILMQAKITGVNGKVTTETKRINQRIEEEWNAWCEVGSCTADGKFSFAELQQMVIKNIGREGENLIKQVYGRSFNPVGFALQPLDNDQLDDNYMVSNGSDGGSIRMGVEVDKYRRPLAYHLWTGHPQDIVASDRQRLRVPADEIIHSAIWERPGQTRGYTWLAAAILALNQYAGWDEATLVAARASAAKFLTIETEMADGDDFGDEDEAGDDRNTDGTQIMTGNAGEALVLDPGQKANFTDPRFPMNSHKDFSQTILRSIATGLLVSYPSLANDLEGVNFSSIRAGLLDERDSWRVIQRWFIQHFLQPVFKSWLRMALLTVLSDLQLSEKQKRQIAWKARGWDWVDPQKDANAAILKLGNGLTTFTDELAKQGLDFEEVIDQRKREQEYITEAGLMMGTDLTGDQGGKGIAAGAESDVTEEGAGAATGGAAKPAAKKKAGAK